jgi:flagellar biogenesis protein FliO
MKKRLSIGRISLDSGTVLRAAGVGLLLFTAVSTFAQTNTAAATAAPLTAPSLPDANLSLLRVAGALFLVIGLFLGGTWLFRNYQRLALQRGRTPKLNVLETRSLGGRHAVFVVGYESERFLVASSPSGVNLLSHLPPADVTAETPGNPPAAPASFTQALNQVLKGR